MTPSAHLWIIVDNQRHVGAGLNHALHFLDITILTSDVIVVLLAAGITRVHHLHTINPCLFDTGGTSVGQQVQVFRRNLMILQIGRQEVDHRCCTGIL